MSASSARSIRLPGGGGKTQLAAAEVQPLCSTILQGVLHMGHNPIADLLAVTLSLDEPCLSENAKVMGNVRLRAFQFFHEITHTFLVRE